MAADAERQLCGSCATAGQAPQVRPNKHTFETGKRLCFSAFSLRNFCHSLVMEVLSLAAYSVSRGRGNENTGRYTEERKALGGQ